MPCLPWHPRAPGTAQNSLCLCDLLGTSKSLSATNKARFPWCLEPEPGSPCPQLLTRGWAGATGCSCCCGSRSRSCPGCPPSPPSRGAAGEAAAPPAEPRPRWNPPRPSRARKEGKGLCGSSVHLSSVRKELNPQRLLKRAFQRWPGGGLVPKRTKCQLCFQAFILQVQLTPQFFSNPSLRIQPYLRVIPLVTIFFLLATIFGHICHLQPQETLHTRFVATRQGGTLHLRTLK